MAAASWEALPALTKSASKLGVMMSRGPSESLATTGVPWTNASSSTMPNGSCSDGRAIP